MNEQGDENFGGSSAPGRDRLELRFGLCSERGARDRNEDYVAFHVGRRGQQARRGAVAVIADGVGGAKGGRVAAELAVRTFIDGHVSQNEMLGIQHNCAVTIEAINRWIHSLGSRDPSLDGMACTLTALILRRRQAHVIHVGDTRLYRLRDDRLDRLTTDHARGGGHVLTRAIGAEEIIRIDYAAHAVQVHDRYLLCSDGVHGGVSDRRLRDLLAERAAPEEAARNLVAAGLAARIGDNATALVVDVVGLPPPDQADIGIAINNLPILPVPKAGAVVDGFALRTMLADGRYTRVFMAEDGVEHRRVIVKFPKLLAGSEELLRTAFLREAWIAARIRSPWVGEVIELAPGRQCALYTVMPCYDGETLERRIARLPPFTQTAGLDLAIKLAKAVAVLHRAGIIHRDIKPDNVLLLPAAARQGPGLKLIDLGVARLPHLDDIPIEHAPGTPSYMAPELFAGSPGDERSDQFALGVTIYRMFSVAWPYGEIEPFSHPRFRRPTSLLAHRPDLPAWLDRALTRAIAVDPDDRFHDILELIFELEHGAIRAAPVAPRRLPLYERNPLAFWKVVAALLALALMWSLARQVVPPRSPGANPTTSSPR